MTDDHNPESDLDEPGTIGQEAENGHEVDPKAAAENRARLEEQIARHAPKQWRDTYDVEQLVAAIADSESLDMFVLALDIDRSTFLMKEAIEFWRFAAVIDAFIGSARKAITETFEGWFDKFTGDGFLAYWIIEEAPHDVYHEKFVKTMGHVIHTARVARKIFKDRVLEELRHNSRNLPSGLGVTIGIDAGPAYLVEIAGDLTIVGPPVVGSTRMMDAAETNEILANVYVGGVLTHGKADAYADLGINPVRLDRGTKEYEHGQEVYLLEDIPYEMDEF